MTQWTHRQTLLPLPVISRVAFATNKISSSKCNDSLDGEQKSKPVISRKYSDDSEPGSDPGLRKLANQFSYIGKGAVSSPGKGNSCLLFFWRKNRRDQR